jgi:hypothetical protein
MPGFAGGGGGGDAGTGLTDSLVALFHGGRVRVLFVLHCFVLLTCLLCLLLAA